MSNLVGMKNTALLIGGGILAYVLFRKYSMATKLNVSLADVDVSISPLSIRLVFNVNNPTQTTAVLNYINGDLVANGTSVASVSYTGNQTLQTGNNRIIVSMVPSLAGGVAFATQWLMNRSAISLSFRGTVSADGLAFPINTTLI